MKKFSWINLSLVVLSLSLLLTGCSKGKDGVAGPAGPAGTAGPTGPAGSPNVIYSAWLDVSYSPVAFDTAGTTGGYVAKITANNLVDSVLQKGTIMTYVNYGTVAKSDILALPYTDIVYNVTITPDYSAQLIELISNANMSTQTDSTSGNKYFQYRYIVIPGGIAGRSAIDWKNYSQVVKYLGIKD
jgi:hypothetical protein